MIQRSHYHRGMEVSKSLLDLKSLNENLCSMYVLDAWFSGFRNQTWLVQNMDTNQCKKCARSMRAQVGFPFRCRRVIARGHSKIYCWLDYGNIYLPNVFTFLQSLNITLTFCRKNMMDPALRSSPHNRIHDDYSRAASRCSHLFQFNF